MNECFFPMKGIKIRRRKQTDKSTIAKEGKTIDPKKLMHSGFLK